ncbi:MAG: MarR family transcriptional regulator [Deltaproteobacteria bacterium]|jgi:DNA-binding MarR family transcriptional regulator|nr:MarR family transcriptional regulator [Deltaproteobacteria bacterium]
MDRIFILIGIINQLATTRINRVLAGLDLPMAQFTLLTHLSQNPKEGWTVTRLANAFEVNQPAMTKTTQRALKKGFVRVEPDSADKRVKYLFPTAEGLQTLGKAFEKLAPEIAEIRGEWQDQEVEKLQGLLERLKIQLDEARD